MKRSGIIFQRKSDNGEQEIGGLLGLVGSHLVVDLWQELVKPVKRGMKVVGRSLMVAAILVVVTTGLLPMWLARDEAEKKQEELKKSRPGFVELIRLEAEKLAKVTEATFFTIEISKIGAYAKVVPNVNATDSKDYEQALKEGVAHAAGTYLPGMSGGITLFAHSTDIMANVGQYNAVFYRLDELVVGDEIVMWYMGEKRVYRVVNSRITAADDVSMFEGHQDGERLYLLTCTPRGTTEKRLVVEAEPVAY